MTDQSDDVFKPEETKPTESDVFKDKLITITNSDGQPKYDSVDKALDGLVNAQSHISNLERENAKYRDELATYIAEVEKRDSVQDIVSKLAAQQNQSSQSAEENPPTEVGLDEQAVKNLLKQTLTEQEQETALRSNRQRVQSALTESYGDKVSDVISEKAKSLGMSSSDLGKLSEQNPTLVLSLFKGGPSGTPTPTQSSFTIQPVAKPTNTIEKPTKSMLAGATSKEQAEYMRKVKASVYEKYGVEE